MQTSESDWRRFRAGAAVWQFAEEGRNIPGLHSDMPQSLFSIFVACAFKQEGMQCKGEAGVSSGMPLACGAVP
ncbi:hypothetical protein, partial [Noviherbaspirillum humi]|uniref:hypothetical protein n=1 Tax=Noviherbaspirillum humi TaxID=1688639 RepID=UPI001C3DD026